jgi:hypothetical protein
MTINVDVLMSLYAGWFVFSTAMLVYLRLFSKYQIQRRYIFINILVSWMMIVNIIVFCLIIAFMKNKDTDKIEST